MSALAQVRRETNEVGVERRDEMRRKQESKGKIDQQEFDSTRDVTVVSVTFTIRSSLIDNL